MESKGYWKVVYQTDAISLGADGLQVFEDKNCNFLDIHYTKEFLAVGVETITAVPGKLVKQGWFGKEVQLPAMEKKDFEVIFLLPRARLISAEWILE